MTHPDFFIVGAPKCATTALAEWLRAHPAVFMPAAKEPHYYNTDMGNCQLRSPAEYAGLFAEADTERQTVGEASVWYLYSREAIPAILAANPLARLIVGLRNPVTMAPSLHDQLVWNGQEDEADFGAAWGLQERRAAGYAVPSRCPDARMLLYREVCALGSQLARVYEHASAEQVLPVLMDDLRDDPAREYARVLDFLGLEHDGRTDFPVVNPAATHRSRLLHRVVRSLWAAGRLRRRLGLPRLGTGITQAVARRNTRARPPVPPRPEMLAELRESFAPEVRRLEALLERDLEHWLSPQEDRA